MAERLRLSWNAVEDILQRAVKRGLSRRGELTPRRLSADETAYRKGHDYITVVTDQEQDKVLHVAQERDTQSLKSFYDLLTGEQIAGIEAVCMDMWPAYIRATREALADADRKIAFDRFHIAQYLDKAVDKVCRQEHRQLLRQGDERMKGRARGLRNKQRFRNAIYFHLGGLQLYPQGIKA